MGLIWPHSIVISVVAEGGGGAYDENDVWVPAAPGEGTEVVYEGKCNVVDADSVVMGRKVNHNEEGGITNTGDAVCYLRKKRAAPDIPLGATCVITWEDDSTSDAVVVGVKRSDNSLDLKRV